MSRPNNREELSKDQVLTQLYDLVECVSTLVTDAERDQILGKIVTRMGYVLEDDDDGR